jgi:phosphoglycolate phosphatase-like HAD superfamily hydrolase
MTKISKALSTYARPLLGLLITFTLLSTAHASDPLPSWNDGASKQALVAFVSQVTREGSDDFVPAPERIATFDNDGTLWSEQPIYFQLIYVVERIKELVPQHPEWKEQEPFASVLKGNMEKALAGGEKALLEMVMATHAGMTAEEFSNSVSDWLSSARHPGTGELYTAMVYQPMLELLDYLRANDFKIFIVSGGGIDFVRVFSEEIYGIPPERVVGSSIDAKYEIRDGKPVIVKLPEIDFIDDKAGKPVGIHRYIGNRPILAVGNSDGDFQMLEWTTAGDGARLGMILHHTDAEREWAYDRKSHIGKLDRGLDEAAGRNWILIDMEKEWKQIYPSAD